MQIFTMRYNLEFRKLTFYGLTRPQSIRKSKQISGQTILSSPQDLDFNPNFAKKRDMPVVKKSVTGPSRQRCYCAFHKHAESQQTIAFFAAVNHLNGPLRKKTLLKRVQKVKVGDL